MLDDEARQALADQLLALPMSEFLDVLRRVLPTHVSSSMGEVSRLVLAEICWREGKLAGLEDWEVAAVAWPERDYFIDFDGFLGPEDLYQAGTCTGCGIDAVSTTKLAMCPLCGTQCRLT